MAKPNADTPDVPVAAAPPRWLEYRRPEDLPPDPGNPKKHDDELIRASIEAHGIIEPQVLDERTEQLISGHGRRSFFMAAEQLWVKSQPSANPIELPDGIVLDGDGRWTVPVFRGWRSKDEAHAAAALVVLNRAGEKGGWYPDLLAERLEEVLAGALDLSLVGYDKDQLDELLAESGKLGARAGAFLDDVAGAGPQNAPIHGAKAPQYDGVELRIALSPAERDEAVALLRGHQRRLKADTMAAAFLELLRAPVPETPSP